MRDPREIVQTHAEGVVEDLSLEDVQFLTPEIDAFSKAAEKLLEKLCGKLGHQSIQDNCAKPEHDFCRFCNTITPGGYKRG